MTQNTTTERLNLLEESTTNLSPSIPSPQEEYNPSQEISPKNASGDNHQDEQTDLVKKCIVTNTSVSWKNVAGLDGAIQALHESVILPIKDPHSFNNHQRPCRSILLYGPPGAGKTHLVNALATESRATFFSVPMSILLSKWTRVEEKMVRELFSMAEKKKPSIIFIDWVDSLVTARTIKAEFLTRMQALCEMDGVVVLAETNAPWKLDSDMKGTFETSIYVPLPDKNARFNILSSSIDHIKNSLSHQDLMEIANLTEDYSGSDLICMARNAVMEPIRALIKASHFKKCQSTGKHVPREEFDFEELLQLGSEHVLSTKQDFMTSLASWRPSVTRADIVKYEEFGKD
ncbi:vacuolar protein sorting protein VPS4 [Acrasis kona]|uniref:Vacuolar protein sorting protein VPS4 n=1 Tax=Acrasis kona TaxID=1008807 RepID=A0AAW2ZP99_9EUKA